MAEPQALGAHIEGGIGTIRVYSETASSIAVCILGDDAAHSVVEELAMTRGDDAIWQVSSPKLNYGTKYALRAEGDEAPRNRFNSSLLLIDPYAKGVVRDNAREYYCEIVPTDFDWQGVTKPNIPANELVIYEAHARGLTRGNKELPDELRGTYAALGHESTIAHLKKIGVNAVELLPIHKLISEPHLVKNGLVNYWGYNTINFFTPHHRYATLVAQNEGPKAIMDELKTAIRELHRNGIEVILDVVYNHTAEGGGGGLTYSYRGLDNSNYYRQDDAGNYQDTTGCGNSLNFGNPRVVQLVLDSLRYWTEEFQIDGYRFDLATTLARDESNRFDSNHPLLSQITFDETFANTKMIVEPWDVGLGGWQTGHYPDRFSEWNDHYRDEVRRFWLSDIANARNSGFHGNGVAQLATRISGSRDLFDGPQGPTGGINFITAHDGFCLRDLVSYNVKHNNANGESNRDGSNNNSSFNHGHEGEDAGAEINLQRRKTSRNLLGTLFFSAGIPMVTAGDERRKTQNGNNNAYCQDSVMTWVNWDLNQADRDLEDTFAYLAKLRRENPVLRPNHFGDFNEVNEHQDLIKWFNAAGEIMTQEDWENTECRTIARYSEHLSATGVRNRALWVIHGSESEQEVTLPKEYGDFVMVWDSAHETPAEHFSDYLAGSTIKLTGASMQLLLART